MKRTNRVALIGLLAAALLLMPWGHLFRSRGLAQTVPTATPKNIQNAFVSAARTASANSVPAGGFEVGQDDILIAYLNVTASSGTNQTLDIKFQDSPDTGTTWFDITGMAFAQTTSSSSLPLTATVYNARPFARRVRCVSTIGGTTPSFTFAVWFVSFRGTPLVTSNTANIVNTDINANAGIVYSKLNLGGNIVNADISGSAAIAYSKLNLGGNVVNADISASAAIASSKLAPDVSQTAQVTVATGQVLALNTTPITLVAAQGAGTVILVDSITGKLVFNSVAYTGSNNLEFRYTNGSGTKVTADMASAFLDSASGTNYAISPAVTAGFTPVANAPVVVSVPTANPGAGNSPLVLTIKYRVLTP